MLPAGWPLDHIVPMVGPLCRPDKLTQEIPEWKVGSCGSMLHSKKSGVI
jgi:hypothetical protein